jgi:hypothetical protein
VKFGAGKRILSLLINICTVYSSILMFTLTIKSLKLFDIINKQSNTFNRTPEPTEIGELESMYISADWLYYASLNSLVSQERYISLSNYLDTIPVNGKYHRNVFL